jgi:hypothetical protein
MPSAHSHRRAGVLVASRRQALDCEPLQIRQLQAANAHFQLRARMGVVQLRNLRADQLNGSLVK